MKYFFIACMLLMALVTLTLAVIAPNLWLSALAILITIVALGISGMWLKEEL